MGSDVESARETAQGEADGAAGVRQGALPGALGLALRDLASRATAGLVAKALALTLTLFAGLFWLAQKGLAALPKTGYGFLDPVLAVLAQIGLVAAFVFALLPASALFLGIFAEEAAEKLEAKRYPARLGTRKVPVLEAIAAGLRLFAAVVLVNLLALPAYLLLPGLNLGIFLLINGWLVGREYFELVALRHLALAQVRRLRSRQRLRILLAGMAAAAFTLVPVLNLLGPIFATAVMVHLFHTLGAAPPVPIQPSRTTT